MESEKNENKVVAERSDSEEEFQKFLTYVDERESPSRNDDEKGLESDDSGKTIRIDIVEIKASRKRKRKPSSTISAKRLMSRVLSKKKSGSKNLEKKGISQVSENKESLLPPIRPNPSEHRSSRASSTEKRSSQVQPSPTPISPGPSGLQPNSSQNPKPTKKPIGRPRSKATDMWCTDCIPPRRFKFSGNLKKHKQMKHGMGNGFMCQICEKILRTKMQLKRHVESHKSSKCRTRYKCLNCGQLYARREFCRTHQKKNMLNCNESHGIEVLLPIETAK